MALFPFLEFTRFTRLSVQVFPGSRFQPPSNPCQCQGRLPAQLCHQAQFQPIAVADANSGRILCLGGNDPEWRSAN
jgi:hypothetical protein